MKHLNYLLWMFIPVIILCSCTITKRHFGNGYHVEWNRKISAVNGPEEKPKAELTENKKSLQSIQEPDSLLIDEAVIVDEGTSISVIETNEVIGDQTIQKPFVRSGTEIQKDPEIQTNESVTAEKKEKQKNKHRTMLHPLTWGIGAMWTLSFIGMSIAVFYIEAFIGVAVCFLVAMIFAFIIIGALRKNPGKYRLKWVSYIVAISAIVLGGITILGLCLFLFSPEW